MLRTYPLGEVRFFLFSCKKGGKVMKVTVNGKAADTVDGVTVAALLKERGLAGAGIVVEHNNTILTRDEWETVVLKPHDMLEIISFVGGG